MVACQEASSSMVSRYWSQASSRVTFPKRTASRTVAFWSGVQRLMSVAGGTLPGMLRANSVVVTAIGSARWRFHPSAMLPLGGPGHGRRRLQRMHVDVEQRVALIALLLILPSQPDNLPQDLHVEAFPLRFGIYVFLVVRQRLDLLLEVLDAFNEGTKPITCDAVWSTHRSLLTRTAALQGEATTDFTQVE